MIYHDADEVFRSNASDLRPLVEYILSNNQKDQTVTIFDKYIGRAAASLMLLAGASRVYGLVVSDNGAKLLAEQAIPFEAGERVQWLMGAASDNMCHWEKLSIGKTPDELLTELKKAYQL